MKRLLMLATVLSVAFLGVIFCSIDASAVGPLGCAATLDTSTENPSPGLATFGAAGIAGSVDFNVDCKGSSGVPCQVCATFTYSYKPNADSGWVAFTGILCTVPEEGVTCAATNTHLFIGSPYVVGRPASFGNYYRVDINIYPVPCDQLETYGGQPLWTGSCQAQLNG